MSNNYDTAFEEYIRTGREVGLRRMEIDALERSVQPDGRFAAPISIENLICQRTAMHSPIRSIATVERLSGDIIKSFPTMELYAMPAATQTLLEDSAVDIDQWIASEVEAAFAEQEGAAFVNGDGVNKPRGFLDYPNVDEANWNWGCLGYVPTREAGALPTDGASDVLIDAVYALKSGYRQNANWVMNSETQAAVRKIKDTDGNYIWLPPRSNDRSATLLGFPIVICEDMPNMANDANAIAFGDFNRGYLVVDRMGVSVLRDPYSAKPYVLFYTSKRVGGGVQDFDAIKLVKFTRQSRLHDGEE